MPLKIQCGDSQSSPASLRTGHPRPTSKQTTHVVNVIMSVFNLLYRPTQEYWKEKGKVLCFCYILKAFGLLLEI